MPLTLHVSDSNDKKVGNSTWVTTSESAKKTRAYTHKFRHVHCRRLITFDSTTVWRAHTHVQPRVINKTPLAYVATPTWPRTARPHWHIIHDILIMVTLSCQGHCRSTVQNKLDKKDGSANSWWPRGCSEVEVWSWYTGRWWVGCYIWYSKQGTGRSAARLGHASLYQT